MSKTNEISYNKKLRGRFGRRRFKLNYIRFKPESKTWYYRFTRDGHTYYKGGFLTEKQAEEALSKHKYNVIQNEVFPEQAGKDMSFFEASTWFFENHALKRKRSWMNDRARIKVMCGLLGNKKLSQIKPLDIMALRDYLNKKGLSPHSVNHYQAELKLIYNRLKKAGIYFGENPACYVEMERVPRARVRFLYQSEERLLTPIVHQDIRVWPYYYVGLHTGMRIGEICNIRVEDISMTTQAIFVPHSKTNRSRYVPMSEELMLFLGSMIKGKKQTDYALSGYSSQSVRRAFRKACKSVEVNDFLFHDLRHTFAQRLLSQGESIYKVAKILGHSSVRVTEDHYGHLCINDLKTTVDKIDGVVSLNCQSACESACTQIVLGEKLRRPHSLRLH